MTQATRVEVITRRVAACVALVYVVGLAVVSLHLARYGVFGLSLAQSEYLLAGVWALVPLAVVGFIGGVIVALILQERAGRMGAGGVVRGSGSFSRRRDMVIGILAVTLGMVLMALYLISFVGDRSAEDMIRPFSFGDVVVIAIISAGFLIAVALGAGIAVFARSAHPIDIPYRVLGVMLAIAAVVAYVGYFTDTVYPRIPSAVGGGAPTAVHIVMRTDSTPMLGSVMRGLQNDAACRHRLLFANVDEYIIVDPRDSTNGIEISRELVAAVRTVTGRVEPCAR